ncbi:MAG: CapA family protein [Holophaga sp.]|nr:CapA family protein [Holophaga sp.]
MLCLLGCNAKKPPAPQSPPTTQVTLVAVGDLLMHQDVKRAARERLDGFQGLWNDVQPLFDEADVVFGNLETAIAPTTGQPGRPFVFNAPGDLPFSLKASGFTVLSTANNHAFDQGSKGVLETLQRLNALGLTAVGSGPNRAQAEASRIVECKGLRIAFLAYTDLLNSNLNRDPNGPWIACLDLDSALATVRSVRAQADFVVVSLHWGNEYEHEPRPRQREVATRLIGAGVDLLLGHHPHVLQPLEWLESEGRRGAVIFSLGNFISNQDRIYDPSRMPISAGDNRDGAALVATLRKGPEGTALETVRIEPLWTENNWGPFVSGKALKREIRVVRAHAGEGVLALRRSRIEQVVSPTILKTQF